MTWLSAPIAFIAAAIAIPTLIILYFLKLRRRDLEVSSTLLWKKSIQDLQANAPFQKLRRSILLLLQLLALAAALLALGQPEIKADITQGHRRVLLIDRSASMAATDGDAAAPGTTRLDAAKKAAIAIVDAMREPNIFTSLTSDEGGDQAMVIAFGTQAQVVQNFTASKAELKRAIEAIDPADTPSRLSEAIKLAKAQSPLTFDVEKERFVARGGPSIIHIFSDGRLPDSMKMDFKPEEISRLEISPDDVVTYHAAGQADSGNLAITALRAQRDFDNPARLNIFVAAQNTFREPRTVDVELAIDNRPLRVRQITLPGMSAAPAAADDSASLERSEAVKGEPIPGVGGVVFELERAEAGIATARLIVPEERRDALAVDDLAYAIFPPAKRLSVALVSAGNLFLTTALEGMNLSRLVVIPPEKFQSMLDAGPGATTGGDAATALSLGDFDVVVLDKWLPMVKLADGSGGDAKIPGLPPGRVLVLGATPPPPMGLIDRGEIDEPAVIIDHDRQHPALALAGLTELVIYKGHKLEVGEQSAVTVIARDQNGPAIVETTSDATRAIIVPFDPGESDWPIKPGFVLFVASSLTYLAHEGPQDVSRSLTPGQTLAERLPVGAQEARLSLPDGERFDLVPAADGSVAYGPLNKVGIYTISWRGSAQAGDVPVEEGSDRVRRALAANLLDPEESTIGARPALALASRNVLAEQAGTANSKQRLWPWLILAALFVIMLEWYVYNRKVHL
ncbi:MAG: VWA domain-containing protein [Phycisphaerales bacterium]|nr:VWA domain-containing protein [Phycisphaerales bacterium]